jgi:pyrimidine deaminase RibD-like protein
MWRLLFRNAAADLGLIFRKITLQKIQAFLLGIDLAEVCAVTRSLPIAYGFDANTIPVDVAIVTLEPCHKWGGYDKP